MRCIIQMIQTYSTEYLYHSNHGNLLPEEMYHPDDSDYRLARVSSIMVKIKASSQLNSPLVCFQGIL